MPHLDMVVREYGKLYSYALHIVHMRDDKAAHMAKYPHPKSGFQTHTEGQKKSFSHQLHAHRAS